MMGATASGKRRRVSWKDDDSYEEYKRSLRLEFDRTQGTIETYEYCWREFTEFLPSTATLADVSAAVDRYREDLRIRRRVKSTTLYQRLSAVHSYFRWLFEMGYIKEDPMARMRMPKRTLNPRNIPTPEVVEAILPRLRQLPRRDRLVIALGAMAGLRSSEIRNLNVDDVDINNGVLRILNAKGHKDREVIMHPELSRLLRDEVDPNVRAQHCPNCNYGEGGPLLPGQTTGEGSRPRMSRNQPYVSVKRHFPEYSPHDLRALFITVALEQGVPLQEVQKQAGHTSADTTVRYQGRRNAYAEAQLRRIDFTKKPPKDDSGIVPLTKFRPNMYKGGR